MTRSFSTPHWAEIQDFSFIAGMRLLYWICRLFGRLPFRVVLYPILLGYVISKPRARASSKIYLRRVAALSGAGDFKPGAISVLRHFAGFAENILDGMLIWSGFFDFEAVRLIGQEQILAHSAARQGGLLICSHIGNLELCRVLSKRAGIQMNVLVHTRHAERFNGLLAQLDPASQLNIFQVTEVSPATAIMLAERVANGEWVAIAGDRIPVSPKPRVATANFLGRTAPFPVGPYLLANLLQCPVYLMFSIRADGGSEVHFELFHDSIRLPRNGREERLGSLVAAYAVRLEAFCLRAPLQWFNFYDFWQLPGVESLDASN